MAPGLGNQDFDTSLEIQLKGIHVFIKQDSGIFLSTLYLGTADIGLYKSKLNAIIIQTLREL